MTAAGTPGAPAGLRAAGLVRDPLRIVLATGVGISAVLHGQMALAGAHGAGWSVLMGAMTAVCLFCVAGLLRHGDPAAAMRMSTGMALAMALVHVLALPLISGGSGHGRHGAASATSSVPEAGHGAMLLVVVVELAVAAGAVAWVRRSERCHEERSEPRSGRRPARRSVRLGSR